MDGQAVVGNPAKPMGEVAADDGELDVLRVVPP